MVMMLGPVKQALPKKDESEGEGGTAPDADPVNEAVEVASTEDDSAA
jgi:hypothetical protein